jgi:hypothetical protein
MADKSEITREVVLANIEFYRDWLIKTRGFRPSTARYYVGLITKLMEAKDPAEVFDKSMARTLATFNNPHMTRAWSKKSGFLKFWEQLVVPSDIPGYPDPKPSDKESDSALDQLFSDDDLEDFPSEAELVSMLTDTAPPELAQDDYKGALQQVQAMLAYQAGEDQDEDEYLDGTPSELVQGISDSVETLQAKASYAAVKRLATPVARGANAWTELLGLATSELGLNLPLLTDAEWAAKAPKEIADAIREGIKQLAKKGGLDSSPFGSSCETMVKLSAVVDFLKTFEKK